MGLASRLTGRDGPGTAGAAHDRRRPGRWPSATRFARRASVRDRLRRRDRHGHARRRRRPDPVARRPDDPRGEPRPARAATGIKVGGHQASSASVVSILTALYFRWLRAGDLVAIKPHASPGLPRAPVPARQPRRRDADPRCASSAGCSRTRRGPRTPTRSTSRPARSGWARSRRCSRRSPTATCGSTSATRSRASPSAASSPSSATPSSTRATSGRRSSRRRSASLGNVTMIVDLNRQSLDRVVPGHPHPPRGGHVRGGRLAGPRGQVRAAASRQRFALPGRRRAARADRRHGERGVPGPHPAARAPSCASACSRAPPAADRDDLARTSRDVPDDDLPALLADLGGHDQAELERVLDAADAERDPADGGLRLHDQGLAAAVRRRQPQPLGACSAPTRSTQLGADARRRPGRPVGRLRGRLAGGAGCRPTADASSATTRRADAISPATAPCTADAGHPHRRRDQHPAGVRRHARGARPRPGGRRRGS